MCPTLEVGVPCRVEGVGITANLRVARDRYRRGSEEFERRRRFSALHVAGEDPIPLTLAAEVPRLDPLRTLARMTALGPPPHLGPHEMIDLQEGRSSHDMPVVHRPASKNRVELQYHVGLFGSLVSSQHVTNLVQKRVYALARRLDQKLVPVLAHVLPEEVESPSDVRDQRFVGCQLQAPYRKERLDGRLDLLLQHFPTQPGHDEVIR